jgi:hypothetical protein
MYKDLTIGVIIPDRGDRPKFLRNCLRMMRRQTVKADIICLHNEETKNDICDITKRYREAYSVISYLAHGVDIIALMENDDYYHPDYLKTMIDAWLEHGKPDIIGTGSTIYYHIKLNRWFKMIHPHRSCAMSTLIRPGLKFDWCLDHDPFTDAHLYKVIKNKVIFTPEKLICMGIKHGVGKCGGRSHVDMLQRYQNDDPEKEFLKKHLDPESFKFYANYF